MQKLWTSIKCFSFVQAHVEDIKKSHLRDLLSNEERSRSMLVYVTYFMKLYSLTIWYFIFSAVTINLGKYNFEDLKIFGARKIEPNSALTIWILHSLKWIWRNSIGLLKAAGHSWNKGETVPIGWGKFLHLGF
jgi:hypothetical protein